MNAQINSKARKNNRFLIATVTFSLVMGLSFSCSTTDVEEANEMVKESLKFQPWESTVQPAGSAAYLGLGTYAKVFCTAIFESGRDVDEAFQNSGKLILDQVYHAAVSYEIDTTAREVTLFMGDSLSRKARYIGDQGCLILGSKGVKFEPVEVTSSLPPANEMKWPMGDISTAPDRYNTLLLEEAIDQAFDPSALTAAFLVIHKGMIIAEKYGNGAHRDMQLESWSMGKSLTATLIGRLIQMGKLSLDQKAPVKEWSNPGDPRSEITIRDLMQMSSGLRFAAHRDPDVQIPIAQLAHMYIYTESINVFDFAVNRPLEFIPGSTGRYRNCDPLTLGYILRNTVEKEDRNYWTWPQEELFDKIGIRRQLLETDPYGNFIMTGFDYGTARNWGRLGLLYLQDGMWMDERLLPEGFAEYVSTPAHGWDQPVYGGLFWLNKTGELSVPKDAFYMAGGGGQRTIIVPSLDLVVVRMGHSEGSTSAAVSLNKALEKVVAAIGNNQ